MISFRPGFGNSTETALLRVSNDILMSSDAADCSALVLLDLSSTQWTVVSFIKTLCENIKLVYSVSHCLCW